MEGVKEAEIFGRLRGVVLILVLILCSAAGAGAESITLGWNPDASADVAGYMVLYGTNSALPDQSVDSPGTSITINGLQPGQTYYFSVAAYNSQSVIGPHSAPIPYLVPGKLILTPGAGGAPMTLTFPVAPSSWYEVQASSDLVNWQTIYVTAAYYFNDWVAFTDYDVPIFPQRFYRLVMH